MVYATRSEYKRLRSGAKEPGTIRWIDRYIQPGQVLFDNGANTGSYSLYAAAKLNLQVRVYAFEAAVNTYASLMENIALNTLWDCVFPLNLALSNRATLAPFVYASLESGHGVHQGLSQSDMYGKSGQHGSARHLILTTTLDALVFDHALPPPDHVKLDVDGHELAILQGGMDVLRKLRPKSVQIEIDERMPGHADIVPLLNSCGYEIAEESPHGDRSTVKDSVFVVRD